MECPECGQSECMIKYGRYDRYVFSLEGCDPKFTLTIQRIYCKHCKTTHAILPDCLIAYSHFFVDDALMIVTPKYCDEDRHDEKEHDQFILDQCCELNISILNRLKRRFDDWLKENNLSTTIKDMKMSLLRQKLSKNPLYQHKKQAKHPPPYVPLGA